MLKISIIGSSKGDIDFFKIFELSKDYILYDLPFKGWSNIHLVSGGASYCDHIAVKLFLTYYDKGCKLTLHLPCNFVDDKYYDDGRYDWRVNPGKTANKYHQLFSQYMEYNTLEEIQEAIDKGAEVKIYNGFHKRNIEIGKSKYMVAFSFSKDNKPTDGGTKYTWNHAISKYKKHFTI
jgi:hypothetical protein